MTVCNVSSIVQQQRMYAHTMQGIFYIMAHINLRICTYIQSLNVHNHSAVVLVNNTHTHRGRVELKNCQLADSLVGSFTH